MAGNDGLNYSQRLAAVQAEFCRALNGKYSQVELARMLGCTQANVSFYLSGDRAARLPVATAKIVADVVADFEVREDDLQEMAINLAFEWEKIERGNDGHGGN